MNYARWATEKEVAEITEKVNIEKGVKNSGFPMGYDNKNLYILNKDYHTMVIGSTGSGKTQVAVLPLINLSAMAEDSIVVSDTKGELYKYTASMLEDKGYEVSIINLDDSSLGNSFNPLTLPYYLYKNNNKDKAMEVLEDIGYYLLSEKNNTSDPFWTNSAIDFFTGLVLYLFENSKEEEINFNSVSYVASELVDTKKADDFIKKIDKKSAIYTFLNGTLLAPPETRGSIISVFNQKIKKYVSREILSNMLLTTDFDLKNISNKKSALFIVGGFSSYADELIPLIINQIFDVVDLFGNKERKLNIILDDFDSLEPIKNFYKLLTLSRGMKINFTLLIKSYMELSNKYGKDETELIKQCIQNLVYLMSTDINTLEEISKYCGNTIERGKVKPLIDVEELKHLKYFESIILTLRTMPIKTKLLPDYEIDYGYTRKEAQMDKRKNNDLNIFEI